MLVLCGLTLSFIQTNVVPMTTAKIYRLVILIISFCNTCHWSVHDDLQLRDALNRYPSTHHNSPIVKMIMLIQTSVTEFPCCQNFAHDRPSLFPVNIMKLISANLIILRISIPCVLRKFMFTVTAKFNRFAVQAGNIPIIPSTSYKIKHFASNTRTNKSVMCYWQHFSYD